MNQYLTMTIIYIFIIALLFLWVKFESKNNKISRYEWIILLFSGLGGFALLMTVYYQIENSRKDAFERNHALVISKVKSQKDFFMAYIDDINSNFPESSQIYFEIFYRPKDFPKNMNKNTDPIKKELVETKICLQMLQVIDDFLYLTAYVDKGTIEKWLSSFLVWFRSNTLKDMFNKYLFMFRPITIDFIKNMIIISNDLNNDINNTIEAIPILVGKYLPKTQEYLKSIETRLRKDNILKVK